MQLVFGSAPQFRLTCVRELYSAHRASSYYHYSESDLFVSTPLTGDSARRRLSILRKRRSNFFLRALYSKPMFR